MPVSDAQKIESFLGLSVTDDLADPFADNADNESPAAIAEAASTPAEGQLALDVFADDDNLYLKSTIAGVKPQDLDIALVDNVLTISGQRQRDTTVSQPDFFCEECYWGRFSRAVVLPVPVLADKISAALSHGVLTITLPKAK